MAVPGRTTPPGRISALVLDRTEQADWGRETCCSCCWGFCWAADLRQSPGVLGRADLGRSRGGRLYFGFVDFFSSVWVTPRLAAIPTTLVAAFNFDRPALAAAEGLSFCTEVTAAVPGVP